MFGVVLMKKTLRVVKHTHQVTFLELAEQLKECRQAAVNVRTKATMMDDLQWELCRIARNSRQEAIRALSDYSFVDHNRSHCVTHLEVLRMLRTGKASLSVADLRMVATCL
jgi:hypothetical protein